MTTQKKRLGGFSKIHVAKLNPDGTYLVPVALTGAKSIEAELAYETVQFYSDNAMDHSDFIFTGGEGTLTVAGLTMAEYNTLFGSTVENGGVLVKSTDISPEVAILFEKNKLGTKDKVYYALYACKFSPPSISAQTFEGGIEEEVIELTFSVREMANGDVFFKLDSGEHVGTKATNFYTEVQFAG